MGEEKAAKLMSVTKHVGLVVGGADKVHVEGVPGARLASPTTCIVVAPVVHGPGKIHLGAGAALTVTLQKYPGAVLGSEVRCSGAPAEANAVATDAADTVKYGVTSTLGGQAVVEQPDGSIRIGKIVILADDGPDYVAKVLGDIATGLSNETGRTWFNGLQDQPYDVPIYKSKDPLSAHTAFDGKDPNISNGVGAPAAVEYDPDAYDRSPESTDPPDAALYHEFGHANNVTHGRYTPGPGDSDDNEENNVMFGIGNEPSENDYRSHRGVSRRISHAGMFTPREK